MENNFEQNIRDAMNNPPELPFEERLWQDMESRMDARDQPSAFLGFIGKLPLLLLTLLMTTLTGFFYTNQYKAMNKIADLEQQIRRQQLTTMDSSIERHVTVIYDTIYNRIAFNPNDVPTLPFNEDESQSFSSFRSSSYVSVLNATEEAYYRKGIFTKPISLFGKESYDFYPPAVSGGHYNSRLGLGLGNAQDQTEAPESSALADSIAETVFAWPAPLISALDYSPINVKPSKDLPLLQIKKVRQRKKLAFYLNQLKPTRYMLSGTTGTFVSLNFGGTGFNLRGSAHLEIGIKDRLIWTTGVEYFSNDFNRQIKPEEEEPLNGFPILPPNDAEDVLYEIQGDFNYLQVPFGFKYIVFPKRYFYPFVGVGLIAGKTTRSRLEYGYVSPSGEYAVSRGKLLPNTFELNALWSSLGFQVQLNRNWSLVLEGGAQFGLKKGNYKYEDLQILKLSTGFQYKF